MKFQNLMTLIVIALAVTGNVSFANAADYSDAEISKAAKGKDGIHLVKKDNKGNVTSFIVVVSGKSRLKRRNYRSDNMLLAKLRMRATAEAAKFLNSESVKTKETAALKKNADGTVTKTVSSKHSAHKTNIAGLYILGQRVDKQGKLTLIVAWSKKSADKAKKIREMH